MTRIVIDAVWMGEIFRQAFDLAMDMQWITLTDSQHDNWMKLVSIVITGIVAQRTASARVLNKAGTSVEHIKGIAADETKTLTVTHVDGSKD